MVAEIRVAIETTDAAELRRSAHAMKGALNHLGAQSTANTARKLEMAGESGEINGADELFQQLDQETKQLTAELETFTKDYRRNSANS